MGKGLVAGLATEGTRTMTFTGTYLAMFAERGRGYFKELNVKVAMRIRRMTDDIRKHTLSASV